MENMREYKLMESKGWITNLFKFNGIYFSNINMVKEYIVQVYHKYMI